jgi:hypothetical protein
MLTADPRVTDHGTQGCREPLEADQASAKIDRAAYADYIAEGVELPPAEDLVTGAIIGSVQVTGCIRDSRSRWAAPGYWHWLTATPRAADPVIPLKGQLSMFWSAGRLGGIVPPVQVGPCGGVGSSSTTFCDQPRTVVIAA